MHALLGEAVDPKAAPLDAAASKIREAQTLLAKAAADIPREYATKFSLTSVMGSLEWLGTALAQEADKLSAVQAPASRGYHVELQVHGAHGNVLYISPVFSLGSLKIRAHEPDGEQVMKELSWMLQAAAKEIRATLTQEGSRFMLTVGKTVSAHKKLPAFQKEIESMIHPTDMISSFEIS